MKIVLLAVALAIQSPLFAQEPSVFLMDGKYLLDLKKKATQKDKTTSKWIDSLKQTANKLLRMKLVSVTDKEATPPSGDKHDYMSQAPYYWYDSSKPNGLPYMRRDGQHNPAIKKITDRVYIGRLGTATRTLALAWYLTREEKYATKTGELIRHWFFNEATRMKPNLEYAQGIPGITSGRGAGLIESRDLTAVIDAAGLISGSGSWTETDTRQLKQWFTQFISWMMNSPNGKHEYAAKNNHGTWYYVQLVDFSLFLGDKEKARVLVNESKKLLDSQLTREGQWPLELARTNGLGYSTFNTAAWFDLARLGEKVGVDLWHYKTSKGAGLQHAIDWLKPYALGEKKWPYQQISPYEPTDFYPLLIQSAIKFGDKGYLEKARKMKGLKDPVIRLLYQ